MTVCIDSPYFFVNRYGKLEGKRYEAHYLEKLWKEACIKTGEDIDMYSGLKHSSCSQDINSDKSARFRPHILLCEGGYRANKAAFQH